MRPRERHSRPSSPESPLCGPPRTSPRSRLGSASRQIRQLTAGLSPAPGQPAIESSSPSILVPSSVNEAVFTLTGRRLAKANPRLFFGDVEAARMSLTDQQALFCLASGILRANDRTPLSYSGRVLLSDRTCGWFHCKATTRAYTVSVVVLPTHLATVRIGFDRKKTQKSTSRRRCGRRSGHPPRPTWSIEGASNTRPRI